MTVGDDAELAEFLRLAASAAGVSGGDLLRRVLHVNPQSDDPRFRRLFETASDEALAVLVNLYRRLRVLNPGLHYVYRNTYLGYRREAGTAVSASSERSQVFLSVVPRRRVLKVVLPVDPAPYLTTSGCHDMTGQGHHGVGELQVDLPDDAAVDDFFDRFYDWLRAPQFA